MVTKKFCDICGAEIPDEFKGYRGDWVTLNSRDKVTSTTECCVSCRKKIENHIDMLQKQAAEREEGAYMPDALKGSK